MAKPNYQFEKRQRDLAKKQKQEENVYGLVQRTAELMSMVADLRRVI